MRIVNPTTEETILQRVYPESEIYIREAKFSDDGVAVEVTCCVPRTHFYTANPIPYVTAENYVRCLSQASYLLAEHALRNNLLPQLEVPVEAFLEAAANYELYYRSLSMVFHTRVARDEAFVLRLHIKNARTIRRLDRDYILFTFSNEKTVISGEMSFVYIDR